MLRVDKAKLGVVAYTYNLGNSGGLDRRVAKLKGSLGNLPGPCLKKQTNKQIIIIIEGATDAAQW